MKTSIKIAASVFAFIFFIPFFVDAQVTNERVSDTISFIPDHYQERIKVFQQEPFSTGNIIFLGNSITEMGDWKKLLNDTTVVNRGIGGDITFGVLKRLDDIIKRQPSKLFILIGINDIGKDIPDAVIADNIRKIILQFRSGTPSTKMYVESIMPVNPDVPGFPQHYDKQQHVLNTNILIKKVSDSLHVPYINIHDIFTDAQGRLDAKYTADGLHLTAEGGGYEKWVAYLRKQGCL